MDDIPIRAIIIGVNIFITITIVSLLVIMFSQMGDIYGVVANTDTGISSRFDDIYSMYHGRSETGVGLLNTLKTFEEENEQNVVIMYPGADSIRKDLADYNQGREENAQKNEAKYLKELMENKDTKYGAAYRYEDRYNVTVSEREDGKLEINFSK